MTSATVTKKTNPSDVSQSASVELFQCVFGAVKAEQGRSCIDFGQKREAAKRSEGRISLQRDQRNKSELWRQDAFLQRTNGFSGVAYPSSLNYCSVSSLRAYRAALSSVLNKRAGF